MWCNYCLILFLFVFCCDAHGNKERNAGHQKRTVGDRWRELMDVGIPVPGWRPLWLMENSERSRQAEQWLLTTLYLFVPNFNQALLEIRTKYMRVWQRWHNNFYIEMQSHKQVNYTYYVENDTDWPITTHFCSSKHKLKRNKTFWRPNLFLSSKKS